MSDYRGYPVVPCPECGASDHVDIVAAVTLTREFGPGEFALFRCNYCGTAWEAIVPEPPDTYEGDGVFAPNH
jgi:hypothetical protein